MSGWGRLGRVAWRGGVFPRRDRAEWGAVRGEQRGRPREPG